MCKIISFEGMPGVGKTTCINNIQSMLQEKGMRCKKTNDLMFFNGDRVGEKVYNLMNYNNDVFFRNGNPYIETFLSQAMRYNLVNQIKSIDADFDLLLEDRGLDTYYSYMLARICKKDCKKYKETIEWLEELNKYCEISYACTFLFHDDINECKNRYKQRNENNITASDWEFLEDVNSAYSFLEKRYTRIVPIEVKGKSIQNVSEEVCSTIYSILGGIKNDMQNH